MNVMPHILKIGPIVAESLDILFSNVFILSHSVMYCTFVVFHRQVQFANSSDWMTLTVCKVMHGGVD